MQSRSQILDAVQPMRIDGKTVLTEQTSGVINPATGEQFATVAYGGIAEIDLAVAAAKAAFDDGRWRKKSIDEKAQILWRVGDLIDANLDELVDLEVRNFGASRMFSQYQVMNSAKCFRYYAGGVAKIQGHTVDVPGEHSSCFAYTRKEPIGVVGMITPWNFALTAASWKIAPALAAGCTGVIKPALETPLSTLRLAELLSEAGVPDGVINVVTGGTEAGAALTNHPDVRKVTFTGSGATAKKIIPAAASNLKRLTLELGGKSPFVICADADLAKAIPSAASVMIVNSGQACVAGTRIFIERSIFDKVVADIGTFIAGIKIGDSSEPDTAMGPLVSENHLARVTALVETGRQEGARVVFGGERINRPGFFFAPTLFVDVRPDMQIMEQEIFGPVVCAIPFDDFSEVLSECNATEYGLAAYLWSKNIDRVNQFSAAVEAGNIFVNGGGFSYSMPFGGFKQSGWGREHGLDGIENYLETKSVYLGQ